MVKKVALGGRKDGEQISTDITGGRERTERGTLRGNTVQYWRRLTREAGMEEDKTENLAKDRKSWKGVVSKRRKFLNGWEEMEICNWHRGENKPNRCQCEKKEEEHMSGWPCR